LYFFQAAGVKAQIEGRSLEEVQAELGYPDEDSYLKAHPEQRERSAAQRIKFEKCEAMRVFNEHPAEALWLQLKGAAVVTLTPGAADFLKLIGEYPEDAPERVVGKNLVEEFVELLKEHVGVALVMAAFELILLGIYGFAVRSFRISSMGSQYKMLLGGLILYFVLISGGVQAVARYRVPVMPVLTILAAGAVVRGSNRLSMTKTQ
jgi:hypothetical protein